MKETSSGFGATGCRITTGTGCFVVSNGCMKYLRAAATKIQDLSAQNLHNRCDAAERSRLTSMRNAVLTQQNDVLALHQQLVTRRAPGQH
jgi:hypothetical protein